MPHNEEIQDAGNVRRLLCPYLKNTITQRFGVGLTQAIIEGREANDLTQKQLSEATGIAQADISRLENGTGNPSIRTLKRLAAGLGMQLKLEFVPLTLTSK